MPGASGRAVHLTPTPAIDLLAPWADPDKPDQKPVSHLAWAENIARLIAQTPAYGFGARSQEADDLVQVAHVCLVRLAPRFDFSRVPAGGDPDGQFRGWAHVAVRKECLREAVRLLNGGTFPTTNDAAANAMRVGGIPQRCPNCANTFFTDAPDAEDVAPVVRRVLFVRTAVRLAGSTDGWRAYLAKRA